MSLQFHNETENFTEIILRPDSLQATEVFDGKYISYIVMGIALIVSNTPILVNILRHAVLRAKKEYLLFAALACADMLAGWGSLIRTAYQLHIIKENEANVQVSWWSCVGTPMFTLITFSMFVQAGMLLVISVDRFIAVTLPLKYATYTRRYAIRLIAFCYFLSAIYTAILMAYAYIVTETSEPAPTVSALCFVAAVKGLFNSIYYIRLCLSTLSVLVYAVVWYFFRRHQNITITAFPNIKTHLQRAQRRITITVGICALFTLIFYIIPTMLIFADLNLAVWGPIYWHFNCLNGVINVFVYSLRHKDIRQGLRLLFKCEQLPSQAEQRLRTESTSSFSATQKAAFIVMEHMGVVASKPIFRQLRSASSPT